MGNFGSIENVSVAFGDTGLGFDMQVSQCK